MNRNKLQSLLRLAFAFSIICATAYFVLSFDRIIIYACEIESIYSTDTNDPKLNNLGSCDNLDGSGELLINVIGAILKAKK